MAPLELRSQHVRFCFRTRASREESLPSPGFHGAAAAAAPAAAAQAAAAGALAAAPGAGGWAAAGEGGLAAGVGMAMEAGVAKAVEGMVGVVSHGGDASSYDGDGDASPHLSKALHPDFT